MSAYTDRLTQAEIAPMLRALVRDKSYRASELGQLVGRYIRWFRNEWGATPDTIRDYEAILARMALTLADRSPLEVDVEDLRAVIDLWADRSPRTRQKVTSVVRAFWAWVEEQGFVPSSPAARLRRPRAPRTATPLLPLNADHRILSAARTARDRVALLCLLDLGLRRGGLLGLRARDFDLARRIVTVTEKGQKARVLTLRGRIVEELERWLLEDLPGVGRPPEPDDFLLYSTRKVGRDGSILKGYPKRRASAHYVHDWWYARLEAAGLVGAGVTSGLNMHRARHTFAVEMRRAAGIDAASQALGHSDLSTTASMYGHYDLTDMERAFEALDEARHVPEKNDSEAPE